MKRTVTLLTAFILSLAAYAQDSIVIPLWSAGAPGFEKRSTEKELAKEWWVKNIHNPSITVFKAPSSLATGAAVLICPGGGHRALVFNSEGKDAAKFLNSIGVTAIVLKYRLFREDGAPYTEEHAKQDVFRAIRLLKSRAPEFGIDTARLGIMGFSAGGELSAWLSYNHTESHGAANDNVDAVSARPAFQVLIYPGPLAVPAQVNANAPPSLLIAANDDTCCSEPIVTLLRMHRQARVPVEIHLYSRGDHAFNMGKRTTLQSIRSWPARLTEWLHDNNFSVIKK